MEYQEVLEIKISSRNGAFSLAFHGLITIRRNGDDRWRYRVERYIRFVLQYLRRARMELVDLFPPLTQDGEEGKVDDENLRIPQTPLTKVDS